MEKMIAAWAILAVAAVVMLVKWPKSAMGYLYCILVGVVLAARFLYPYTSEAYEVMHCFTLGGGIGAVFGLFFAVGIHQNMGPLGVLACILFLPLLMFAVGFVVILVLGFALLIQQGHGGDITTAGLLTWALIAAIVGGGGSIIVIIFEK